MFFLNYIKDHNEHTNNMIMIARKAYAMLYYKLNINDISRE